MSSPIIFEKGTRDFSTLGLGLLSDAIQATTTEELNGQFIFEMDYPVSGNNADLIKENRIIVVNSGHILKRQGFIIRQIVRKIDLTMTVYAEHVSYATLDVALAPMGNISGDAKTALENWKRMLVPAVDFTVDSDILTTNSTKIGAPEFETARQGLGGHAGSILDVWGGEYQFDNWHIRLLKQRGKSANAIIAYGRNLISFEQDTNIADTYTSVYPYYQENSGDEENKTHFLPERIVDSEFVGKYPNPKVLMLDLSNKFKDVADYSETKLRNYALSYIQSNNIGVPKVNMKISTVDLSRATGGFSEDIDLGDTVNVYFEKLGITTSAKVIKAVWNVLSDDYDKFEIGARRASLTESISELATTADENANKALNQAFVALQSADGKSTIYYLNSSDPWPTNPKENDTAFVKDGENSIMYRYMFNNETGVFSWVKILDSMSADQIKQRVSDALESGKAYSDQLVADNIAQVNTVLSDVQAKQADLTAQQAELDTKAQGYANKALADAKANTLATATQTAKDAQEYTNTAKAEAISVATTADGVINQKIDDTASSITRTINQNKSDADGKISTAQSTATQALDGLTQKVSQNTYDAKVNELTGKISTAQQTADGVVTTVGNYKTSNDERVRAAESAISQNAENIALKVAKTDYDQKTGELSGKISEISQTAGKISQSVSDVKAQVDGLSVGGRNLVLGTATDTVWTADSTSNWSFNVIKTGLKPGQTYTFSAEVTLGNTDQKITTVSLFNEPIGQWLASTDNFKADGTRDHWTFTVPTTVNTPTASLIIYAGTPGSTGGKSVAYHHIKLETGNMPSDWTPAPEDTDYKISTVSQTVDSISSIVSDPTTGLTKRVQTAEGTLSQVTGADIPNLQKATYWQPYSSLDFNSYTKQGSFFFNTTSAKTNGPTTSNSWTYLKVEQGTADNGRIKQTAWYDGVTGVKITYVRTLNSGTWSPWYANDNDSVTTIAQTNGVIKQEISDRQNGDTNTLTQAKDFTTSSISNSESGMKSLITQTSDAIIAKIEATNLVTNSEFDPDNVGWYKLPADGSTIDVSGKVTTPIKSYYADWDAVNGSRGMEFGATTGTWITSEPVRASSTGTYSISVLAGRPTATTTAVTMDFRLGLWDKDKKYITSVGGTNPLNGTTYLPLKYYKSENITVPSNTAFVSFVLGHSGSGTPDAIYHPMINHGATISPYTPTYGTTASSTVLSLLKDNWSIGIADNAGAITNGIVGNSTNMSLISNNVVINAPSTQIKGTAWINSAMIGNGAIGTAQIGDAAITSAKIADLDVSKITGNVSNFVKSGWDDVYGNNVKIDGQGMRVSYGDTSTTFANGYIKFKQLATYAGGSNQVETIGGIATTHAGTVNHMVLALYDQTHIPFGSTTGKNIGSPANEIYGGDAISIGKARDFNGNFDSMFSYANQTAANYYGQTPGFNFRDTINFNSYEIVSGSVNYNLKIGAIHFNGYFGDRFVPVIVASWSGNTGGGIAFGEDNVMAFNQTSRKIIS